jgi:hypothetical protein
MRQSILQLERVEAVDSLFRERRGSTTVCFKHRQSFMLGATNPTKLGSSGASHRAKVRDELRGSPIFTDLLA